jgi:hypothetical protein
MQMWIKWKCDFTNNDIVRNRVLSECESGLMKHKLC